MASDYSHRYHKYRRSLEDLLEKYVQSTMAPKYSEDLKLALQESRSPIFLIKENLLKQGRDMYEVAEELFRICLCEQYEASQKEKEEMLHALTRQYVTVPSEPPKKIETHPITLFNKQVVDLLSRYFKCEDTIIRLQKKIDKLDVKLLKLHKKEEKNLGRWKKQQDDFLKELTNEFRANNIPVRIRNRETDQYEDFKVDSPEAKAIFRETLIPPPPPLFINILFNPANAIIHRETVVPVEYIPLTKLQVPRHLEKVQTLVEVIDYVNSTANIEEKESGVENINYGKRLLDAIKKGKDAIQVIEAKPRDVKVYEEQCEIENKKQAVMAQKKHYVLQRDQEKEKQKDCARQYEKLNHKPIDQDMAEHHHHTLKPNN